MLKCSPAKPRVTRVWVGPFPEPFQTKIATIFYAEAILGRYGGEVGFLGRSEM
jgi:hypothetical protein